MDMQCRCRIRGWRWPAVTQHRVRIESVVVEVQAFGQNAQLLERVVELAIQELFATLANPPDSNQADTPEITLKPEVVTLDSKSF